MDDATTLPGRDDVLAHLADSPEALRFLFGDTAEARLVIDDSGSVVGANPALERLFGWSSPELVGRTARVLVPERLAAPYARLRTALFDEVGTDVLRVSVQCLHRDGRELPVRLEARRLLLRERAVLAVSFRDRASSPAEDRRFRDLLEGAPDGNLIVDEHGTIVMVNARAETIFGYDRAQLVGSLIDVLVPEAARAMHAGRRRRFTGRARQHAMAQDSTVLARRADGSTFPVRVTLSTLRTDDGLLVSAAVRDMSEVEALRAETARVKDEFIATVSHELRTPLASIMGYAELMAAELDDLPAGSERSRLERYVEIITRNAQRELDLVEHVLTLTTIDSRGAHGRARLFDLAAVAETAAETYAGRARERRLELSVAAVAGAHPPLVHADPDWFGRAVGCLVSNAVKFTPAGGRVVLTTGSDAALGRAWLEVRDTGPGIDPAQEDQVFHRLVRGSDAVARHAQGTGLGLAIAREVVEAGGGELSVVRDGLPGARLRATYPLATADSGLGLTPETVPGIR